MFNALYPEVGGRYARGPASATALSLSAVSRRQQ